MVPLVLDSVGASAMNLHWLCLAHIEDYCLYAVLPSFSLRSTSLAALTLVANLRPALMWDTAFVLIVPGLFMCATPAHIGNAMRANVDQQITECSLGLQLMG